MGKLKEKSNAACETMKWTTSGSKKKLSSFNECEIRRFRGMRSSVLSGEGTLKALTFTGERKLSL